MHVLRLVGVTEDGGHLVLTGGDTDFALPIDAALRSALRRDVRQHVVPGLHQNGPMSPVEVQALIRGGADAEEAAERAGWSVEKVRRYEGPILAEREHVARLATAARLRPRGPASGSPTLIDRVTRRLAERGVSIDDAEWDSWRGDDAQWVVDLEFVEDGHPRRASWSFSKSSMSLRSLDAEAARLSDDDPEPYETREAETGGESFDPGFDRADYSRSTYSGYGESRERPHVDEDSDLMATLRSTSRARNRRRGGRRATAAPATVTDEDPMLSAIQDDAPDLAEQTVGDEAPVHEDELTRHGVERAEVVERAEITDDQDRAPEADGDDEHEPQDDHGHDQRGQDERVPDGHGDDAPDDDRAEDADVPATDTRPDPGLTAPPRPSDAGQVGLLPRDPADPVPPVDRDAEGAPAGRGGSPGSGDDDAARDSVPPAEVDRETVVVKGPFHEEPHLPFDEDLREPQAAEPTAATTPADAHASAGAPTTPAEVDGPGEGSMSVPEDLDEAFAVAPPAADITVTEPAPDSPTPSPAPTPTGDSSDVESPTVETRAAGPDGEAAATVDQPDGEASQTAAATSPGRRGASASNTRTPSKRSRRRSSTSGTRRAQDTPADRSTSSPVAPSAPESPASAQSSAPAPAEPGATNRPQVADAPGEEARTTARPTPLRKQSSRRRGRASVPAWDDIMFGAKPGEE